MWFYNWNLSWNGSKPTKSLLLWHFKFFKLMEWDLGLWEVLVCGASDVGVGVKRQVGVYGECVWWEVGVFLVFVWWELLGSVMKWKPMVSLPLFEEGISVLGLVWFGRTLVCRWCVKRQVTLYATCVWRRLGIFDEKTHKDRCFNPLQPLSIPTRSYKPSTVCASTPTSKVRAFTCKTPENSRRPFQAS